MGLTQLLTPPHHTGCLQSFAAALFFPLNLCYKENIRWKLFFLVSVFQDAAWPRSFPRTEAVKQRNPYRLISSMSTAALAPSHAVRMSTNQNKTTHNRKAELCTQGAARDSTSSPSAHPQPQPCAPASLECTLQEKAAAPGSCPKHSRDGSCRWPWSLSSFSRGQTLTRDHPTAPSLPHRTWGCWL